MAGRGVGGWGGRAGVQYSAAWSDLASLQRVMKQLRRSATYTPIFLPNERMSRAQVKNEPAQRGAALREKKKWDSFSPRKTADYTAHPPLPNSDFSGDDWLNWKQPPPTPKHQSSPLLHLIWFVLLQWSVFTAVWFHLQRRLCSWVRLSRSRYSPEKLRS